MGVCSAKLEQDAMTLHARCFLALGGLGAASAVALAAVSQHAWRERLAQSDPAGWFALALQSQQNQSFGLILIGLAAALFPASKWFTLSGWTLCAGLLLFSGSLYLRSIAGLHAVHAATPFGGSALIVAWLFFAIGALRLSKIPR
jgi:uncharacterized membrane protein YgdD (TMEM256/DUF423 family)